MTTNSDGFKLGPKALARRHFEPDTRFSNPFAPALLAAYEEAADKAARAAKTAIKIGQDRYLREAQWYEAVVASIENLLASMGYVSLEGEERSEPQAFELPEPPDFK